MSRKLVIIYIVIARKLLTVNDNNEVINGC